MVEEKNRQHRHRSHPKRRQEGGPSASAEGKRSVNLRLRLTNAEAAFFEKLDGEVWLRRVFRTMDELVRDARESCRAWTDEEKAAFTEAYLEAGGPTERWAMKGLPEPPADAHWAEPGLRPDCASCGDTPAVMAVHLAACRDEITEYELRRLLIYLMSTPPVLGQIKRLQ